MAEKKKRGKPFTKDQDRAKCIENGRKGGKSKKHTLTGEIKTYINRLLEKEEQTEDGTTVTGAEIIAQVLFDEARSGNMKAIEILRDTAGQKPVDKVAVAELDEDVVKEVESLVDGTKKSG